MPPNVWRSTQKYPTNGLCARGFARELQLALIGTAGDTPNYPEVERGFRDATGADLGRATWHGWWHGQRLPNATYRTLVDNALDGLATRWLYRSLEHDRLHQLLSMGVSPGTRLRLHQRTPVLVMQVDHTEIAMDHVVAQDIYVWMSTDR